MGSRGNQCVLILLVGFILNFSQYIISEFSYAFSPSVVPTMTFSVYHIKSNFTDSKFLYTLTKPFVSPKALYTFFTKIKTRTRVRHILDSPIKRFTQAILVPQNNIDSVTGRCRSNVTWQISQHSGYRLNTCDWNCNKKGYKQF